MVTRDDIFRFLQDAGIRHDDKVTIHCSLRSIGKIENGETPQEALKREIKEELDTEIEVGGFFMHIDYEYPTFFLQMDVFRAIPLKGRLQIEAGIHSDEGFFAISELNRLDWCPADSEHNPHKKCVPQVHRCA